jgi:hypothetical protein
MLGCSNLVRVFDCSSVLFVVYHSLEFSVLGVWNSLAMNGTGSSYSLCLHVCFLLTLFFFFSTPHRATSSAFLSPSCVRAAFCSGSTQHGSSNRHTASAAGAAAGVLFFSHLVF